VSASNGASPGLFTLREVIRMARRPGVSMADLTVLAPQNDPYRVDTPAGHRDAAWCRDQLEAVFSASGRSSIHTRGLHYAILDVLKPNGSRYRNTAAEYDWLQGFPVKAGRWLGYVPFEAITDNKNDPPIIRRRARPEPRAQIYVGVEVEIPDADDIEPWVGVSDFEGRQPYHFVFYGEKSSLFDVTDPIAERLNADLYLTGGELSDTLLYQIARDGAEDGRPMQVFTLSDFDPAGHQMPISIGRKLQALRDLYFPALEFEVRPIALNADQVSELGLPSTPLKEKELRADKWRAAFGVEQTEIDALGTLRPDVLTEIIEDALAPFYDPTLEGRVRKARVEWRERAQFVLDSHTDTEFLDAIRATAAEKLAELDAEIEALNESLTQAVPDGVDLPEIVIPEPEVNEELYPLPLVSSSWPWADQTRALIERKRYGGDV
jgi:hypothetical protein